MLKYFKVMLKIFEIFHVKKIVESWLVCANKLSWIMFLEGDNKTKLVAASFLELVKKKWKINFNLKIVVIINNHFNKLSKLFYLHCSCKKVVEKWNTENLKIIKNTLLNKSGNPGSLKK